MNQIPQILEEFEQYWLLYKPSGWFVHPPADKRALRQFSKFILTDWFWGNLNQKAYPIHRLDFSTEGLMIWAKDSASASALNSLHYDEGLKKTYHAVVRGLTPSEGSIDIPLLSDSSVDPVYCLTQYRLMQNLELPVQINHEHSTSRYSLVEVNLITGRWHQIRRHFNRIAHPIIGDAQHGDSHHNRYFRDQLKIKGLLLKAHQLEFVCPFTSELKLFTSPISEKWHQVYSLFGTPGQIQNWDEYTRQNP